MAYTKQSWSNLPDTSTPITAARLGHLEDGIYQAHAYAAARSNVKVDFGAAGDGSTDDTAALQAAIDSGVPVFLPEGSYKVTSPLLYRISKTTIEGAGDDAVIQCDGSVVSTLIGPATTGIGRCVLRNVKLLQTNATNAGTALDTSDMPNFLLDNVRIDGFNLAHRNFDTSNTTFYQRFTSLLAFDCNNGIATGGSQANQNTWIAPRIRPKAGGGGTGIALVDTRGATFIAPDVEASSGTGITGVSLDATTRECWFINPWIEGNGVGLSVAAGVLRSGIIGGSITGNTSDISNSADPAEFTFLSTNRTGTTQWSVGYVLRGAGVPALVAPVGSLYLRTDGGAGSTLYVKESGTGSSGWVAK